MLADRYTVQDLRGSFLPRNQWRPFPPRRDREAWEKLLRSELNRQRRDRLVEAARPLVGQPWPTLPATAYLAFAREGIRADYETPQRDRRLRLATLVLAECLEGAGRFVDEIVNGIWTLCEESAWTSPAHLWASPSFEPYQPGERLPLPAPENQSVDLADGDTALLLAEISYLLADELDQITPILRERIVWEINRRVWEPVEQRDDFMWFTGRNNWTPWVAGNVIGSAMYLMDDPQRLAELTWRMMDVTDRYIAGYPEDGGCDEGPGYWNFGPGALLMLLELLYSRSNGKVSVYDEGLIHRMAKYPLLVNLADGHFANFADVKPTVHMRRTVLYRFGERVGHGEVTNFALYAARGFDVDGEVTPVLEPGPAWAKMPDMLRELWWMPADAQPTSPRRQRDNWLPAVQVWVGRETEDSGGLLLAAKGGHNGENHNHNDVGQFIIALDGEPVIVDIGCGTYTRKTFSPQRYEIWYINSSGHDVPAIDGTGQQEGAQYAARDVRYESPHEGETKLTMDLAGAYPEPAGLHSLRREMALRRGEAAEVVITDAMRRAGAKRGQYELPLYTPREIEQTGDGEVHLTAEGRRPLVLSWDAGTLELAVETIELDDPTLQTGWGEKLHRLRLQSKAAHAELNVTLRFRAGQDR